MAAMSCATMSAPTARAASLGSTWSAAR
jgi:hypothetical protein